MLRAACAPLHMHATARKSVANRFIGLTLEWMRARGNQVIQAKVVTEMQASARRPGNSLDVETLKSSVGQQCLHLVRPDEFLEIMGSLRNPSQTLADGDHQ